MKIMKTLKSKLSVYFIIVVILILIAIEGVSFWWIEGVIQIQVSEATLHTLILKLPIADVKTGYCYGYDF